jgi:hypothetical protein
MIMAIDLDSVLDTMKHKGYRINEERYVPNIVGIRTADPVDQYNDKLVMFWKNDKDEWETKEYAITTDPGKQSLLHPENPKGTAILAEGHYQGAFKHGTHKRGLKARAKAAAYKLFRPVLSQKKREELSHLAASHHALVQSKPLTVYRDNNKDERLDLDPATRETGEFFINIHRSDAERQVDHVGRYSAGCQAFQDPREFDEFLQLLKGPLYRENYDYTLLRDDDIKERRTMKKAA